ncbi:MAG TPA: hypothetical protein VGF18_09580 [Candidatus Tumulicola sp.]
MIVTRCDLAGESHKAVAADLAISRRQFYRDLEAGRRRVGEFIELAPAADDRMFGDWKFAARVSLADAGHFEPAGKLLYPNATGVESHEEAAWDAIRHAQALQGSGHAAAAASLMERCVAGMSSKQGYTAVAADVRSLAYTLLTFCYFELGKLRDAAAAHALNPASIAGAVSMVARKQYLSVDAMLACDGREGTGRATAICIAFHRFAVQHGFIEEIASSLVLLSSIARYERRFGDAERLARESLTLYRAMSAPGDHVVSLLAGIAIDRGDAQSAIELAREARSLALEGSHAWWASYLFEAEAANLIGKSRIELELCAAVERDADTSDGRILSWTRRIQAGSFTIAGETVAGRRAADDAPDCRAQRPDTSAAQKPTRRARPLCKHFAPR